MTPEAVRLFIQLTQFDCLIGPAARTPLWQVSQKFVHFAQYIGLI